MNPLYSFAIGAYSCAVALASPFNEKAKKMRQGHREVWKKLRAELDPQSRYVWVHAASLGEFEQGRPIIERIRKRHPELKILLTFFSPSGYEVRKNYGGADIVCYLPFDHHSSARRFVRMVNPVAAVFVKYEIWRNYLLELSRLGVPAYLVSAIFRKEQKFFQSGYGWYARWLRWFKHIFVQNEESRELLATIGIDEVTVCGDSRFDRVMDVRKAAIEIPEISRFAGGKPGSKSHSQLVFVAGSSWPKDEDVYAPWLQEHKNVKAVIAPHEFDASRLEKLKRLFPGEAVLLSELRSDSSLADTARVVIIDCFGLLSSAYAYGDIAYVGGGFGVGIHNLNEAAVYGIPVIFGPNHARFKEAEDLKTLGGGIAIDSRNGFAHVASRLLFDEVERKKRGKWAADYIAENCGASDVIYDFIEREF